MNQIQTTATLTHGLSALIGTVDLSSDDRSQMKDSLLSEIPIVGPLFRFSGESQASAKVQLSLKIDPRDVEEGK